MTKKSLLILVVVLLGLVAVYFASENEKRSANQALLGETLLSGVDSERIERIVLKSGNEQLELAVKGSEWTLPSRRGYAANREKVNGFLLKVFDLPASQKVPASEEGIKKLGLDDEGVNQGHGKVVFLDKEGKDLGGIYLGENRKQEAEKQSPRPLSGEYARRTGDKDVYLIPLPLVITTSVSNWIDPSVANVLSSAVYSVIQESSSDSEKRTEFELVRDEGTKGEEANKALRLKGEIGPDEQVQKTVLSQVGSGLENFSLTDVKASDSDLSNFKFNYLTTYRLKNGLVYTVSTAQEEKKVFAKIAVRFDPTLAQEVKEWADKINVFEAEKEKAANAEKAAADQAKAGEAGVAEDKAKKEQKIAPKPKVELQLSNEQEADKLNGSYSPWVYELASFQGEKFRKNRSDLVKPKEKKDEAKPEQPAEAQDEIPMMEDETEE